MLEYILDDEKSYFYVLTMETMQFQNIDWFNWEEPNYGFWFIIKPKMF
jgi:hypothetical protein